MTTELLPLGNTDLRIRVDLDTMYISFGADTSQIHCWSCGRADEMAYGAYRTKVELPDARLSWIDGDAYVVPVPSWWVETRTEYIVCLTCVRKHDPSNIRKPMKTY